MSVCLSVHPKREYYRHSWHSMSGCSIPDSHRYRFNASGAAEVVKYIGIPAWQGSVEDCDPVVRDEGARPSVDATGCRPLVAVVGVRIHKLCANGHRT